MNTQAAEQEAPDFKSVGVSPASGFSIERLGVIAEPKPDDPREAWGILNPGAARGRDGELYLFPRVVAEGNFSRIAIARVLFDGQGRPAGIKRLGYALEPTEPYERNPKSGAAARMRGFRICVRWIPMLWPIPPTRFWGRVLRWRFHLISSVGNV